MNDKEINEYGAMWEPVTSDILVIKPRDVAVEIIRIDLEGRLFWHGREVETDDDFRKVMLELHKCWTGEMRAERDELLEALKLAQAIIGHPDDQGSKFIAAAIAKAEVTK